MKYVTIQQNQLEKVTSLLNLKRNNLIIISGMKPLFRFYNYFGVLVNVIEEKCEEDQVDDKIKCMIHLKEINYLIAGSRKGLIYIYELKHYSLFKKLKGHGGSII